MKAELGWTPAIAFEEGIASTIAWYLSHRDWLDAVAADSPGARNAKG